MCYLLVGTASRPVHLACLPLHLLAGGVET